MREQVSDRLEQSAKRAQEGMSWSGSFPVVFLALFILTELIATLRLNAGRFTYTLDDPYIHLALAERIAAGHYGINPGEPAAPSSSILWPFLLAPFVGTPFFQLVPLAICTLAAFGTVLVYHRLASGDRYLDIARESPVMAFLLTCLLTLTTNVIGLVFSGMEHSLQVLLTTMIVIALMHEAERGRVVSWLLPAIIIAPLVRYECLGISLSAVVYLLLRGYARRALLAAVGVVVSVASFSLFLLSRGLDALPSSVMHKSLTLSSRSALWGTLENVQRTLSDPAGRFVFMAGTWMLGVALLTNRRPSERAIAASMALATGAHALFGGYGANHRWEVYIVTAALLSLLYLERHSIGRCLRGRKAIVAALAVAWAAGIGSQYILALAKIPTAANNIFEQQYQMHRFARDFERGPVIANDIGLVSYDNPYYVLDLVGQGSRGFVEGPGRRLYTDSLQVATARIGIRVAMVYDEWFPTLPREWRKVGELHLSRPRITPAWDTVAFYATSEAAYPAVLQKVLQFRATLPSPVRFTLYNRDSQGARAQ